MEISINEVLSIFYTCHLPRINFICITSFRWDSLPARTSIIAAANPVGGHYNKAKTVSENLKMNSALLSRFDLVFILLDKPDEEMDNLLSEHVMALHSDEPKDLSFRLFKLFIFYFTNNLKIILLLSLYYYLHHNISCNGFTTFH